MLACGCIFGLLGNQEQVIEHYNQRSRHEQRHRERPAADTLKNE